MNFAEAIAGLEFPPEIRDTLILLDVPFTDFHGNSRVGQLLVHRALAGEVEAIFAEIEAARFPLAGVEPVSRFGWSDELSMAANNSSAFNYRTVVGKPVLSQHAYGRALDINPLQNPYVNGDVVLPPGACYDPAAPGTLLAGAAVVDAFVSRGWSWGGDWQQLKDWHHFEKRAQL